MDMTIQCPFELQTLRSVTRVIRVPRRPEIGPAIFPKSGTMPVVYGGELRRFESMQT
jgi:hypothetical protein